MTPARFSNLPSFRRQSTIFHGGLVALVAIGMSCVFGLAMYRQITRDQGLAVEVVAQNIARTLAAGLDERARQIEALAADTELRSQGLSSPTVRSVLERAHATTPYNSWIGVAALDGTVQASSGGILQGASVSARPWFQDGLKQVHVGDVHGALLLARYLPALSSGEPQRFVDFSAPIVIAGKVVGVIGQHGSWEWAHSVVALMEPANAAKLRLEVLIFNKGGELIYTPASYKGQVQAKDRIDAVEQALVDARAVGSPAIMTTWDDGTPYLTTAAQAQSACAACDLGWTVVVREPRAVAYAAAEDVLGWSLAIGTVSAVLAAGLANLASRRMSRPLSRISESAKSVASGARGAVIEIDETNRELAQLSMALSEMTAELVAGKERVEERVRERTAELDRANDELRKLARFDPLTGLLNRRAFDERMAIVLASAKRSGKPLSMLMIDIDHFKRVNDRFGHDGGDQVLKTLATVFSQRLRETDVLARLGGEEFAVLLPDTDARGAILVAEDLVRQTALTDIRDVGRITISVGSETRYWDPEVRDRLIRNSDQALYSAKNAGRNRACQWEAERQAAKAGR